MSDFKSGVVHEAIAVTEKETAMATIAGMKESKAWEGLFDTVTTKRSKSPCHNFEVVPLGLCVKVQMDGGGYVHKMVTSYKASIKGVPHRHFLEQCTGCDTCVDKMQQRYGSEKV